MAENQYKNKVVLADGTVLIDLTPDDVLPENVDSGIKFHDKSGAPKVGTSRKTVDASEATATAAEILLGKTAGKGSEIITGTMPDNSGKNVEIKDAEGTVIPKGFSDGSAKAVLSADELSKLIPGNIKEGVTILGVAGAFGADDISSQTKEVTPTFADQTVQPDAGVSYLSSVKVKAIPVSYSDNNAGGVTVTIGA
jgi:hypothetical protein